MDGVTNALNTATQSDLRGDWFLYGAAVGRVTFDVGSLVLGAAGLAESVTNVATKLTAFVNARNAAATTVNFVGSGNSGIMALTDMTATSATASGHLSATAINSGGYALTDLTAAERSAALEVMTKGDQGGKITEGIVESVGQRQGLNSLEGGKYGSNNGFDHVFQTADGNTTILMDSKQVTNGSASLSTKGAGGFMQMSDDWVGSVLSNLDPASPAYKAVNTALNNGTLVKGVIGVDRPSGNLIMIRVK